MKIKFNFALLFLFFLNSKVSAESCSINIDAADKRDKSGSPEFVSISILVQKTPKIKKMVQNWAKWQIFLKWLLYYFSPKLKNLIFG